MKYAVAKETYVAAQRRSDVKERLYTGHTGRILLSTAGGNSVILVAMIVLSPMLPRIMETSGISPVGAGLALSVMWGAAGLAQFPGGRISDELTRKTVLVGGLGILAAAALVLTQSTIYAIFLFGTAAIGISAGLYWPTMFVLAADHFVDRRGGAFGIIAASGDVGGLIAIGLAQLVLSMDAWRVVFVPIALGSGAIAVSIHRWHDEAYVLAPVDLSVQDTLHDLLSTVRLRLTVVAFILFMFVYQGTTSFLPTLLRVDLGFSESLANYSFALLFVAGVLIKPLAGRLSDRADRALVVAGATLLASGGLALFLYSSERMLVGSGLVLFAAGVAATWPTIIAYVTAFLPKEDLGGDLGGFRTLGFLGGSLGPTYVGFVAERISYTIAFAGFAACLLTVALITLGLARRY